MVDEYIKTSEQSYDQASDPNKPKKNYYLTKKTIDIDIGNSKQDFYQQISPEHTISYNQMNQQHQKGELRNYSKKKISENDNQNLHISTQYHR